MADVNRIGFTELTGSERVGRDPRESGRVNIIFVHGLRGHPCKTWTSSQQIKGSEGAVGVSRRHQYLKSVFKSSSLNPKSHSAQNGTSTRKQVFWPQDYLAEDVAQARVWTYGYDADVIGGLFCASGKDSVSQHGRNLAVRLEREVDNEDPIIFVAHSLGGILVKDAIRRSEASRQRTRLIVFLGTPHRGSGVANWGDIASNLACLALQDSNEKIVKTLEVDSEVLDIIHEQFVLAVSQCNIRVHSFQEGQGISGVKGLHGKVVNDFSSKLDLPTLEQVESINSNHTQMARCRHRSDESYRAIAGVLKQFLKSIDPKMGLLIRPAVPTQPEETPSAQQEADPPRTSTAYCNIPPRNRRFVGRTEKLKELEERLVASSDCQKLALVGLGGVGKTQVALQLVYTLKECWPDCSIFWVPAVSSESFEQAYRKIASDCSIALSPMEEDPKESVQRYLSGKTAGKWLLVIDNADDEEILFGRPEDYRGVADYMPESQNGLTLFTTRHRQIAVSLAGKEVVDIQNMTNEEAETFLRKSLTYEDLLQDEAATAELLTELTHLPLAIAQAAAYLNAMQISLREYLSLLKHTEEDAISLLSQEFRDETRYKGSGHAKNAVATTWLISFNHIRRSDPIAADLLSFMSCIEHKAIPQRMLPGVEPVERMVHALGTLRAYAFVIRQENSELYDMHRLVHLASKVWLREQGATKDLNEKIIVHLTEIFPCDDYPNRFIWREYLPHALRLLGDTKGLDVEARYELCVGVGRCLRADGRIKEAVGWLSECCLWRQSHFPEDHPDRLASQHALAGAYEANGQVKKAVELLEHVVTIIEKKRLAEDHPYRLASQHELARAYEANGQISEAVELLEHVVIIEKKRLTEDHPDRLTSQHELAETYQTNKQIKKAVELLEHVVAKKEVLTEDHPDRLASQHELARAYKANEQISEVVELLEHVVTIEKKRLAEDHPDRLTSQHELAGAYQANEQIKKAVELLEHVVAKKEVLAEDHPDRLASQHELARAYKTNGQISEAVELLEHVVTIKKKTLTKDHPDRLASQHELAGAYMINE